MKTKYFFLITLQLFCLTDGRAEQAFQSHESIYNAAKSYITDNMNTTSEYSINISPMDKRLKLPLCEQPLQSFSKNVLLKNGRVSIGVRCSSGKSWSLFISATIKIYKDVYVLAKPLAKGQKVTPAHLTLAKVQQSKLRRGYLTDFFQIKNKLAKKNLSIGTIIDPTNFAEPKVIHRGEKVIISASSPYFDIRMPGQAMMDGIKGQIINVKNLKSNRMIQATAIKPGLVSVIF